MRKKIGALLTGLLIPVIAFCGLESATYISDLVASNPLSSDLASTADDHIRLLKSTIKTTFPNINGAVTSTDEQLNPGGLGANPTGTIGLTAVNGSATTYLRSDGAPALSQSIEPTWSARHTYSLARGAAQATPILLSSAFPFIVWDQSSAAANNRYWDIGTVSEQLLFRIVNDADNTTANWLTVDRTGTTVDTVAFPTDGSGAFRVGGVTTIIGASRFSVRTTTASTVAGQFSSPTAATSTVYIQNEAGSGDNIWVTFTSDATNFLTARGSIDYNRGGGVVRYNTTSDARLKKNFRPAPSARSVIDCIQIESFDWRETGYHVEHGVVAQRLNKCAPYAVSKGDVWQVDKSTLIPALIKYTQELEARLDRLESQQRFQ